MPTPPDALKPCPFLPWNHPLRIAVEELVKRWNDYARSHLPSDNESELSDMIVFFVQTQTSLVEDDLRRKLEICKKALIPFSLLDVEASDQGRKHPLLPVFGINQTSITPNDVLQARAALDAVKEKE